MPPSTKPSRPPSPWLKRVLIPFWTVQLFLMLVLLAVSGLLASNASIGTSLGITIIYLFFESICTLLLLSEITLFARRRLHPGTYLVLSVVKATIWTVVFVIYVVRLATLSPSLAATNPLALVLGGDLEAIILLLAFTGSLIYASIIYHRARRARRLTHPSHTTNPTNPDDFSAATDFTAPPRYSEERMELPEAEERWVGERGIGQREGRREELEGEGGVFELEAGGSGRRRVELGG